MMNGKPLVSVGIPTYNHPEGLQRTLRCITGQTYRNLEIIVSDNCSPGTEAETVVREFMKDDRRIRYFRQDENKGPTYNFDFVLRKAAGEYFMWAADDDEWKGDYVSTLLSVMNQFPKSIVSFTNYMKYSENGDFLGNEELIGSEVCEMGFRELIGMVFSLQKINVALYGLFRRKELQTLLKDGFPNCDAPDRVIFAHFALSGKTVTLINKYLYKRTIHDKSFASRDHYTIQHSKSNVFLRNEISRLRYYIMYIKLLVMYGRSNGINNILYFSRKFTGYVIMIELLYLRIYLRRLPITMLEMLPCSSIIKSRIKRVISLLSYR